MLEHIRGIATGNKIYPLLETGNDANGLTITVLAEEGITDFSASIENGQNVLQVVR